MSKTTLLLFSVLILPTLGAHFQHQSPSPDAQDEPAIPSKVACSDSTTLSRDQRSPEACAKSDFALYGHPVMFPLRDGFAFGVSVAPEKPGSITIWMDNQTEKPKTRGYCCNATFIWYIDLYDQSGLRIPSELETINAAHHSTPLRAVAACTCSGFVTVPSHSVKVIDHGDLATSYKLAPGQYTIIEYPVRLAAGPQPTPSPTLRASGPRLIVSVL